MKKIRIVIAFVLMAVLMTGITIVTNSQNLKNMFMSAISSDKKDESIVATVDGEKIYQYEIDAHLIFTQMQRANLPDDEKDSVKEYTAQEILENRIESIVLVNEAKRQGIKCDYKEAKNYIKDSYDMIMEANDENTIFLKEYLINSELSENEYLQLATESHYRALLKAKLMENFYKENGNDLKTEEYEKYKNELIRNADIKIKSSAFGLPQVVSDN